MDVVSTIFIMYKKETCILQDGISVHVVHVRRVLRRFILQR